MARTHLAFLSLALAAMSLAGCSTVQTTVKDALDYGRGPFDQSPAAGSEAALEGLHESSWGNSGKWGGQAANAGEDPGTQDPGTQDPDTQNPDTQNPDTQGEGNPGEGDPEERDPPNSDPPNSELPNSEPPS